METVCRDVRLAGDYFLERKIGVGSFAVVWRARHRLLGLEVAVKEIDKRKLSRKLRESFFKEIDILRDFSHPHIVRLHEAIQTEEKIYLVLEYCAGGDLAAYINRHGRVSEATARRLMQQLASGLQVLRSKNLIHRDIKPQNLLLSSHEENSVLKIADFGFARYLTPNGFADTLCGSPLYMAPEIIQNQKYDAKADLWSVGAVLFHLVTGKPPFDGETQFQLFQNIVKSDKLQFPPSFLRELHPDCVDLCQKLLCRNPVERLTSEDFFNHKFMVVQAPGSSLSSLSFFRSRSVDGDIEARRAVSLDPLSQGLLQSSEFSRKNTSIFKGGNLSNSIERGYVIISSKFSSVDSTSSKLLEESILDGSTARGHIYSFKDFGPLCAQEKTLGVFNRSKNLPPPLIFSFSSQRLQLLSQYAHCLSEFSRQKLNAGKVADSFSLELVVLALWREILHLSGDSLSSAVEDSFDVRRSRVVEGFLAAFNRAETISNELQNGDEEMPHTMEIIYQSALSAGKNGAVDEFMGNLDSAVVEYSNAVILFSFLVREGPSLPLNPPFSLSSADQQRILGYIACIESHLHRCSASSLSRKQG